MRFRTTGRTSRHASDMGWFYHQIRVANCRINDFYGAHRTIALYGDKKYDPGGSYQGRGFLFRCGCLVFWLPSN